MTSKILEFTPDDMGTNRIGKVSNLIHNDPDIKTILILCPVVLQHVWADKIVKAFDGFVSIQIVKYQWPEDRIYKHGVRNLTVYFADELSARKHLPLIAAYDWDLVVQDRHCP